ncbi:MAG: hypothetical protein IT204_13735 [Fimbriimonadaceae bacterium]|nr:hypothetical protein [Fimbriimonadaceae bacterium]
MRQVTLVGAGSFDFTGPLLRSLLPVAAEYGLRLCLCDHDAGARSDMAAIALRLAAALELPLELCEAATLEAGLEQADFAVLTLNAGGQAADVADFAAAVGAGFLPKHVDTIGPAGWLRALRMGALVRRVLAALPPQATLLNLSNPLALIVRMAARRGVRAVGFCHGAHNRAAMYAPWLGLDAPPHLAVWGTNHLSWLLELHHHGTDLLPRLYDELARPERLAWRLNRELLARHGLLPVLEDQHNADFFEGFNDFATLRAYGLTPWDPWHWEHGPSRSQRRAALAAGQRPLSSLPASAEGVERVIAALLGGPPARGIYNTPLAAPANGAPAGAVIESWTAIAGGTLQQDPPPALPPALAEQLQRITTQQDLAAAACLDDQPERLVDALAAEPNVTDRAVATNLLRAAARRHANLLRPVWHDWATT